MPQAEVDLDGAPASVAAVRAFVRETLRTWGASAYEWAATTVASELATNAVLHAGTRYTVALRLEPAALTIEVSDGSPNAPVRRRYGTDAGTGRGIALVAQICDSWQVAITRTGKVVRCLIKASSGEPAEDPSSPSPAVGDGALLQRHADDGGGPAPVRGEVAA